MIKTIENKIRLNIVLIYITTVVLCCAMLLFFYYSRNNINEQKRNIEAHEEIIVEIQGLVESINEAQQEVNQYIATKQTAHLDSFNLRLTEIEKQIDTLKINTTDSIPKTLFRELEVLLNKKGETIQELRKLFASRTFSHNIHQNLKRQEAFIEPDTIKKITFIEQDTVIKREQKKKNLWKRITSVFSSKQPSDTVITISKERIDTVKITSDDRLVISKLDTLVRKAQVDYKSHITSIEEQVILLILSDQEISSNISNILINLYNNFLDSRLDEIKNNESWLRNNNTVSIIIGLIALFLILLFIILIINDVNKGLRMRKSLEEANLRTKQLMESRHKLLLSVSHDIKTPLNSILGYLELNNNSNKLTSNDLSSMSNSGKYILSLLENLLKFSSLQQGTLTASLSDFNLYNLCEEIKEMFLPLTRQKGLLFDYSFNFKNNLHITSDLLKIKQIIINVLSNAVKYTPEGKISFQVDIEADSLSVLISDTGIGIPEKQINQVFQPFTRIDENKNIAEGTGFGMYVVKGLVDLLAGKIIIKSKINAGTSIHIKLPVSIAFIEEKTSVAKKIIIVDDDPSFSNLLTNMLNRLGHTVQTCNSLVEFGKHKQQLTSFDLIFTDMEIGSCSGIDILHEIRKINTTIPVFIITGRSDFNKEQAISLGFNDYLPKPVSLNALSNTLNQVSETDDHLKSLREMFDNDEELIRKIIATFHDTTEQNLVLLKHCINTQNFSETQAVCHKMLPMFLQIGQYDLADFLKRMDSLRGKPETSYPEWKEDAKSFISQTTNMLKTLNQLLSTNPFE